MIVNPNKYKLTFPTIYRMWEKAKDVEDYERTISDIGVTTNIHLVAVCMVLEQKYNDLRIPPIREKLEAFYKIDSVIPLEPLSCPET